MGPEQEGAHVWVLGRRDLRLNGEGEAQGLWGAALVATVTELKVCSGKQEGAVAELVPVFSFKFIPPRNPFPAGCY